MAEIPDVVGGETILVSWGNPIRDRTVQRYADATQRGNLNPSPSAGDLSFLESTSEFAIWNGASWASYATFDYVDSTFVPSTGGTFSGPMTFRDQVEIGTVIGQAAELRLSGNETSAAGLEIGMTNPGGGVPVYPDDYWFLEAQVGGDELHLRSFAANYLSFSKTTGRIAALANIDFGGTRSIINPGPINAYVNGSWSIRMQDTLDGGASGDGGFALTKATRTMFQIYAYATGAVVLAIDTTAGTFRVPYVYSETSAGAANVYVDSSGVVKRSTSSLEYKRDVSTMSKRTATKIVRGLDPIRFRSAIEADGNREFYGFGFEPTAALDKRLASDGNYDIRGVVAALVRVVQELI